MLHIQPYTQQCPAQVLYQSPVAPSYPQFMDVFHNAPDTSKPTRVVQHNPYGNVHAQANLVAPHHTAQGPRLDPPEAAVPLQQLLSCAGQLLEMSRTSTGSSFIQASLRDKDPLRVDIVWRELRPFYSDLLLDAHGCYVMRTILEVMMPLQRSEVVTLMANDEQLLFSMCTHSLHTRRVVQFLLESGTGDFIVRLMINRCKEIATTQQGCIAMQRGIDHAGHQLQQLCCAIYNNLYEFAKDPFANYVVQYLLEKADRDSCSSAVLAAFGGHITELACNKFASNVLEKCLVNLSSDAQHAMIVEMYTVAEAELEAMLQDSFGNYIIQSSIALAQFRDLWLVDQHLRPALKKTPYGYKIETRLDRRMRGKAVGSRPTVSVRPQRKHINAKESVDVPSSEEAW